MNQTNMTALKTLGAVSVIVASVAAIALGTVEMAVTSRPHDLHECENIAYREQGNRQKRLDRDWYGARYYMTEHANSERILQDDLMACRLLYK